MKKSLFILRICALCLCAVLLLPALSGCSDEVIYDALDLAIDVLSTDTVGNADSETVQTNAVTATETEQGGAPYVVYTFASSTLRQEHYEKHGIEMGFADAESYEAAACAVINNPDTLFKTEEEDGDYVYYLESTNEFVIVSLKGYIRTYFCPTRGKAYFDEQ